MQDNHHEHSLPQCSMLMTFLSLHSACAVACKAHILRLQVQILLMTYINVLLALCSPQGGSFLWTSLKVMPLLEALSI